MYEKKQIILTKNIIWNNHLSLKENDDYYSTEQTKCALVPK